MEQRYWDQLCEIEGNRKSLEVRHIKLGTGGKRFEECLKKNLMYIGFQTHERVVRELCNEARNPDQNDTVRKELWDFWFRETANKGTATNFTNSSLSVAQDRGDILWITIEGDAVYYGLTEGGELQAHQEWQDPTDNPGSVKRMKYGWSNLDKNGNALLVRKMSGALTKTKAAQGTISKIRNDVAGYFISHILGEPLEIKEKAISLKTQLINTLGKIIKDLQPSEFEVLVDLIFSNSGWKRDGEVGGNIKFVDVTLNLPSTGEMADVQVKTSTNQDEFDKYISGLEHKYVDKFFYVYHTGSIAFTDKNTQKLGQTRSPRNDMKIYIWGTNEVAEKAIDAGLSQWVIDRSYK